MAKKKKKRLYGLICFGLSLIWFVLYFAFLWKIPFYLHINSMVLPEDSNEIVTKVDWTDYASVPHVVAQKVFVSSVEEQEIREFIVEKNRIDLAKDYLFSMFEETFTDYGIWYACIIDPINYVDNLSEEEWGKCYTILYTSVHNDTVIWMVLGFGVVSTIIINFFSIAVFSRRKEETQGVE